MPGKIKSKQQLKFLRAAASGSLSSGGPSKETAKKMLQHESHETKSRLMRGKSK